MSTHVLILPVSPLPFPILIALIGRNVDDSSQIPAFSRSLKNMYGTHYISTICFDRITIRPPNQRLCGHMDKNIRIKTAHRSEEHTYELQSLMRISYAVFCLKKKQ